MASGENGVSTGLNADESNMFPAEGSPSTVDSVSTTPGIQCVDSKEQNNKNIEMVRYLLMVVLHRER